MLNGESGDEEADSLIIIRTCRYADHFISMNNDFQSMRRVSRRQHREQYLAVRREQLPDRAAHQYLLARDDFVNTDRDTVHQWFEYILYSAWPWLQVSLSPFGPSVPLLSTKYLIGRASCNLANYLPQPTSS